MAMSLRYRTIFILGLLLLVLAGLFSALFYHFGTEQFSVVEQRMAERFARHTLAAVNDELAAMGLLTRDWANWDDTYAFIEDLNPAYIRSHLTDETFANLHLNLMLFVRTSGEVAFARAYDLEAGEEMPIPQSVYDALPILTGTLSPGTGQQGVLLLPEGVLLVTTRPILTSREEGPARGTLVFGRFLSDDLVARIRTHLGASAAIYRWDRPEDWPADLRRVSASLSPTRPVLARPLNEEQIAGYALLTDLYGNPALVLTVVEERDIYLRFRLALRLFMVNVAIMGLLFAGVVTLLLDRLVLARLAALAAEVRAIGAQGNSGRAVTVRGGDELAGLAEAINDMLAAIEQARRKREEREARLSRLAENSPDVIYRLAFSPPRLEYVSPAITRLLGYPPEDFYTYPRLLFRLVHPEDRRLLWAALRAELPPEEPLILRWINRNGEMVWAEHRHTVVRDREGRAVAVEGIARDITERKRAEAEIAQLNAVLRAIRNVNQIIAREKDRGKLLQSVCEELVNTRSYNAAWVVLTDGAPHIAAAAGEILRAPPDLLRRWEENILPLQVRWVYDRPDALLVKTGNACPFLHRDPPSNGMLVRIAYAGKIYGILYAILPATQEFSPEEQSLFAEVAGDIAFALYSLEQEEAIRRHAAQLEAIRQAGLDLTAQLDLDVLLHSIIRRAVELVGGSAGGLYLYHPEEDVLEWVVSIGPHQPPIGTRLRRGEGGLSRRVWETGQPFWVDDYQHWEGRAPKYADYPWTAVISIPVRWREEFQGVIIVQTDPPRTFSAADADLLTLFATHAAVALANARLFASAEREQTRLDFLYRLGQRLSGTLDAFAIAQEALDALCRAIAADKGVVYLYEPTDARLRLIAVSGYSEQSVEAIDRRLQLRLGQGLAGWVALHHQTAVVDDVLHDERWLLVPGMDEEARAAISTPILARGERIGVVTVLSEKPAAFTPEDGQLVEAAASVIGAALLNARLYEAEQARARRLALVNQLAAEFSALQEPEAVYRQVVERIAHAFAYDYVGLMLMDDARGDLVFVAGAGIWADLTPKGFRQKLDEGMIGWVARHGETLLANDVSREPRYIAPYLTETRAELDVPLKYYGQVVGVLTVQSRHLNAFSPLDVLVLEALAGHIAAAIVNARLFEQERRARERTEALYHIGQIVNSTLDPDAILDQLTEEAVRATGATHGSVLVPDPEKGCFERRSFRGYSPVEREKALSQPLSMREGLNSRAYRERRVIYAPDTQQAPDYYPLIPQTRSELVVPILRGDWILGHLDLQSPQVDAFRNVDMEFLRALADQVAIALENARLYTELRQYAGALEEQVRERTAQLAAQYMQLEAILRSTGDGIILTNSQGEILLANPVAQKWLAHNWAPEDARKLQEAIRRVARWAQEQPREILELPGLDLEIRASPVEGPGGEGAAVVILHDVAQFKTLERLRTRFISNISHELRTPLTTIKTYLHLLRGMPELLPEYLDVLEREVDWQARLVEDVLEISRLDSGALQMHFSPVGLNPLTAEVVDAQRPLALTQGLALECHLAEEGPVARADPDSLRMVLINLIRNSIQYTPSGGRVKVTTGEEEWEGRRWATVTVADTGIGIPKDELPYIFDRFFRGERPRQMQIPGTGLGLSIVKEVVDRHGGRIMVESEEGKGTRFTCWLPVAEEEPPMMDAERGTTNNTG